MYGYKEFSKLKPLCSPKQTFNNQFEKQFQKKYQINLSPQLNIKIKVLSPTNFEVLRKKSVYFKTNEIVFSSTLK
jgi:hypothetical protein